MRLLNTYTLKLREFAAKNAPLYAILSHTWEEEEVTFQDIQHLPTARKRKGFDKVQKCCEQAIRDGFGWVWIDTCCIDKSSSTELSEAINSMYQWYKNSTVCYAYLNDVKYQFPDIDEFEFKNCRWFTRGWTLQELIAPLTIEFYASDWSEIGTKTTLEDWIASRTGIPPHILLSDSPSGCTVAQRMSWASDRVTTRAEDMAYCLLGIFNVNMPLLYGEGNRAFIRLQEEIMRKEEDYTLFLWSEPELERFPTNTWKLTAGALSISPSGFPRTGPQVVPAWSKGTSHCNYDDFTYVPPSTHNISVQKSQLPTTKTDLVAFDPPQWTSRGLYLTLWAQQWNDIPGLYLAWTYCTAGHEFRAAYTDLLCVVLYRDSEDDLLFYRWSPAIHRFMAKELYGKIDLGEFQLKKLYLRIVTEDNVSNSAHDNYELARTLNIHLNPSESCHLWVDKLMEPNNIYFKDSGTTDYRVEGITLKQDFNMAFKSKTIPKEWTGALAFVKAVMTSHHVKESGHFLVIFGLWEGRARCIVEFTKESWDWIDLAEYREKSRWASALDRAKLRLFLGKYIYVAAKHTGVRFYSLHISVRQDSRSHEFVTSDLMADDLVADNFVPARSTIQRKRQIDPMCLMPFSDLQRK
jgi:hypothetical protein